MTAAAVLLMVVIFPDGCARTLPAPEAVALMAARGATDGLRMYPAVSAYVPPSECERRVGPRARRSPIVEALTPERRQAICRQVLQTTMVATAREVGCSKFTIRRIMAKESFSKRAALRARRAQPAPEASL